MRYDTPKVRLEVVERSSPNFPTCRACSDTAFVAAEGGVVRCQSCRQQQPRPPDQTPSPPSSSPSPSPITACSIPPAVAKTQRARMVAKMEAAGPRGVTNREFIEMGCFRYSSRLHEIRRGREVDTIPVRGGLYRYVIKPDGPRLSPACESKKSTNTTPPLFAEAQR